MEFSTANSGYPMLIRAAYGSGTFYALALPDDFADIYRLPQSVLTQIRSLLGQDLFVSLDAPDHVSLFVYDNDKFIVESFAEEPVQARIVTDKRIAKLRDIETGEELNGQPQGNTTVFDTPLTRGTYRVFSAQ